MPTTIVFDSGESITVDEELLMAVNKLDRTDHGLCEMREWHGNDEPERIFVNPDRVVLLRAF